MLIQYTTAEKLNYLRIVYGPLHAKKIKKYMHIFIFLLFTKQYTQIL